MLLTLSEFFNSDSTAETVDLESFLNNIILKHTIAGVAKWLRRSAATRLFGGSNPSPRLFKTFIFSFLFLSFFYITNETNIPLQFNKNRKIYKYVGVHNLYGNYKEKIKR